MVWKPVASCRRDCAKWVEDTSAFDRCRATSNGTWVQEKIPFHMLEDAYFRLVVYLLNFVVCRHY
jgi:hypothetical protein